MARKFVDQEIRNGCRVVNLEGKHGTAIECIPYYGYWVNWDDGDYGYCSARELDKEAPDG